MKFRTVKLSDIAEITMGQSPKSEFYNSIGEGIPFLQGNRTFGMRYPYFDTYTTKVTKKASKNDILMSVRAPVGDLNIADRDLCLGRGLCSIRMKNGNHEFLYYLLKYNKEKILTQESGTVFGSINKNIIENLLFKTPESLEEQIKISKILSNIDNKIELNNKLNDNFTAA